MLAWSFNVLHGPPKRPKERRVDGLSVAGGRVDDE
jgi:hypothetical protein